MTLTVTGLCKAYNGNQVIRDVDFSIAPGEIVILLGKSGTGKTTFMRLLNNLEEADRGTIKINDDILCQDNGKEAVYTDRNSQRRYQNQLGMVFQDYQLFPNFSVLENLLEAPLAQELADKASLTDQALTLLAGMGLADKADVMPSTLSGGQKQRVAIARAMMLSPDVICFDEPTSALDRQSADQVGELIKDIASQGKGILIVTHDTSFGESYGSRIISSESFL
ncbi:polar amino acid ABC transporter ATP-binding protein [Aerococcus urinaehominis]|uniref:Polar amino acid ABC transporter ATP-binding protein n=1 Tax=Aerococcus urinaehominis TaxID=128944 RepID=A0A120IB09_9LACT|nr:ATP-binding cassette domain-containing protein [Aerococcus urinaehominis]AMB99746.1 polar amino acid ABC transporter ATP-binding protein [Aerococcus urinaehominis]SDM10485.1 polar amino acid transport system ATP-binding protein [Aerococcus urinaehominis]